MVSYFGILKNKGFVKGMFIASAFLTLQGNGVCYGMEKEKNNDEGKRNEEELSKIKNGRFIIVATDFCSSILHSLVTGYFLGHNAFPDHLGWYAELKSLSVGYKKNFLSFLSFNFEISVFRFLTTSIIENFVELCAMDKNRIKNKLLFDPDLGKKNPYWKYYGYYIWFIFIHGFTVEEGDDWDNYYISENGKQCNLHVKSIKTNPSLLFCKLLNFININVNIYFKTNLYITLNILPLALIFLHLLNKSNGDFYFGWEKTEDFGCAKNLTYETEKSYLTVHDENMKYHKKKDTEEAG